MKYLILKSADKLMLKIQIWAREHRDRMHLIADYKSQHEVRLVAQAPGFRLEVDSAPGCTLSIQQDTLIVACSQACAEIEQKVVSFLQKHKLIGIGTPLAVAVPFHRKNVRHAHEMGRPVSDETKAKRRQRRLEIISERPRARFATVLAATEAAAAEAGIWIVLTERARKTASESQYIDPDYVHQALMDLAHAAKHNANCQGLGMPWVEFLRQQGGHDFVPNTSTNTIERFSNEYHINHQGVSLCIQAHIRQGVGAAQDCVRIYVVQPRKPGDPIIVGQIGAHLPIADRSH